MRLRVVWPFVPYLAVLGTFIALAAISTNTGPFEYYQDVAIVWGILCGMASCAWSASLSTYYANLRPKLQYRIWRLERDCELPYTSSFWLGDADPDDTLQREWM